MKKAGGLDGFTKFQLILTKRSARDGSGWCAKFLKDDVWVAYAYLQNRTHKTVEFVWFSVDCRHRRQNIGRKFVEAIAAKFPDKKLHARDIIDSGRLFWDSLISDGLVVSEVV